MVNHIEDFAGDGVYVFRFNAQRMVKRVQFTKSDLSVVSDNTTDEHWELTRNENR
ncbi:S24 family peptidase [Vibrio splendidus]